MESGLCGRYLWVWVWLRWLMVVNGAEVIGLGPVAPPWKAEPHERPEHRPVQVLR